MRTKNCDLLARSVHDARELGRVVRIDFVPLPRAGHAALKVQLVVVMLADRRLVRDGEERAVENLGDRVHHVLNLVRNRRRAFVLRVVSFFYIFFLKKSKRKCVSVCFIPKGEIKRLTKIAYFGLATNKRHMPTRCFWPPENECDQSRTSSKRHLSRKLVLKTIHN